MPKGDLELFMEANQWRNLYSVIKIELTLNQVMWYFSFNGVWQPDWGHSMKSDSEALWTL